MHIQTDRAKGKTTYSFVQCAFLAHGQNCCGQQPSILSSTFQLDPAISVDLPLLPSSQ